MDYILTLLGIIFIGAGIWARFGGLKGVYLFKGIPGILPSGYIYIAFPVGIWLVGIGVVSLLPQTAWIQDIVGGGALVCLVISILLMIWQPSWLKPAWLRWLENNYRHQVEILKEEARQMGIHNWEAHVKTQADLKRWAENVAKRYSK